MCQFPQLLHENFLARAKRFRGLYPYQQRGFQLALLGKSIVLRADTNAGKTAVAMAGLHRCVCQGKIGVYLVPSKQLLAQKQQLIEEFFNLPLSLEGVPHQRVRVLTLAGERKPTKEELRQFRNGLILIATYEAFRAFCFAVQNRQYFPRQKNLFGTVVVDEAHYLGDKTRGMPLQTLIYKLQREHRPQFIFMSATFDQEDGAWLADQLGGELLYVPPDQTFNCEFVLLEFDESAVINHTRLPHLKTRKTCEIFIFM